eukprot:COSAG01_NODE_4746_length_4769_cov_29.055460_2_plen_177_part_00
METPGSPELPHVEGSVHALALAIAVGPPALQRPLVPVTTGEDQLLVHRRPLRGVVCQLSGGRGDVCQLSGGRGVVCQLSGATVGSAHRRWPGHGGHPQVTALDKTLEALGTESSQHLRVGDAADALVLVAIGAVFPQAVLPVGAATLQSKRLLIESRWVSKPLAFAGKLRPRRLNN